MIVLRDSYGPARSRTLFTVALARNLEPASTRHLLGRSRHRDLEDTVLERSLGLIHDRAFRQRDLAIEGAAGPLEPVDAAALLDVLLFPFAGNRDRLVADLHVNIIRIHAGQIRTDDELVI